MNRLHMTQQEAKCTVIRGAQKYLTLLKKQQESGTEGIEVHLSQFIKELDTALDIMLHGRVY